MEMPYKLEVLWCRTFQSVLKVGNYFMGYRMPKYLEGPGKIKELGAFLKEKGINDILVVTGSGMVRRGQVQPMLDGFDANGIRYTIQTYDTTDPTSDDMVEIGSASRTVHTPATPERLPDLMEQWFRFREQDQSLIGSFVAHFYFVYVHPFCDGNGRTARIVNASSLYHAGWKKMKSLPLSNAINNDLSGYYRSLEDSEYPLSDRTGKWLDLSPFVSYMLDVFEQCMIDATLSRNELTPNETKLLDRMNRVSGTAEITVKKAAAILGNSESAARNTLRSLVKKGYLTEDISKVPFIYSLEQHFSE